MATDNIVVFITSPSEAEATRLAHTLVEERLAACVNRVAPIASTYWWQGEIEETTEVLLVVKTASKLLDRLVARVKELHSYTVPEVIALPLVGGNAVYLRWIDESVARPRCGA